MTLNKEHRGKRNIAIIAAVFIAIIKRNRRVDIKRAKCAPCARILLRSRAFSSRLDSCARNNNYEAIRVITSRPCANDALASFPLSRYALFPVVSLASPPFFALSSIICTCPQISSLLVQSRAPDPGSTLFFPTPRIAAFSVFLRFAQKCLRRRALRAVYT